MRRSFVILRVQAGILAAAWLACGVPCLFGVEPGVESAITKLESERVDAMLHANVAALERILADDLTYIHSSSIVDTKASFLSALSSGRLKYKAFERSEVRVRVYEGAAVVTGKAAVRVETGGNELALKILFTDVYVKGTDGSWRMVAWQSTKLPD